MKPLSFFRCFSLAVVAVLTALPAHAQNENSSAENDESANTPLLVMINISNIYTVLRPSSSQELRQERELAKPSLTDLAVLDSPLVVELGLGQTLESISGVSK